MVDVLDLIMLEWMLYNLFLIRTNYKIIFIRSKVKEKMTTDVLRIHDKIATFRLKILLIIIIKIKVHNISMN